MKIEEAKSEIKKLYKSCIIFDILWAIAFLFLTFLSFTCIANNPLRIFLVLINSSFYFLNINLLCEDIEEKDLSLKILKEKENNK